MKIEVVTRITVVQVGERPRSKLGLRSDLPDVSA